jgi:type I restriction enzyme, S subunit
MINLDAPARWARARLDSIADVRLGRQRSPSRAFGPHMMPYLRAANITWQGIDLTDVKEMDFTPSEVDTYRLKSGDILLAEASGSPSEVGKPGLYVEGGQTHCFQNTLIRVRATPELSRFLHLHFLGDVLLGRFAKAARGVGIQHLGAEALSGWEVALPSLSEQQRIADAVDSYLTRLDDAVASLERARVKLKAYRASVLKAAVEGRLVPTEASLARAEKRDYEPAEALLARILKERHRRWEEAELGRLKGAGKSPKDDKWKRKYEEPRLSESLALPELPEGWTWARISILGDVQLGRQRAPAHHHGRHMRPYLRVANVFEDRIDTGDVKTMNFTPQEFETYRLRFGDILLNEGQSPHLIGRPAMYRDEVPGACFQNTLIRFRATSGIDPRFALVVFRAQLHARRYMRIAQITTNIAHLGAGRFGEIEFPLPPTEEQKRIADEVERLMSIANSVEFSLDHQQTRSTRLRQSILRWAFEGKLVDEDPNDEPAEKLLVRIRAERVAAVPVKTLNGRRRKGAA